MPDLEKRLDFDTEITAVKAQGEDLIVEGYLATYDLDRQNERWVPGSWGDAIKGFMNNPSRPVLYEHKREYGQFGTVETLEERDQGLWGRLRLPKPAGGVLLQAWEAVKAGITKGVSIRAPMVMSRQSDGTAICIPRSITEASITPFPVNESSVVAVAQKAFEADEEAEIAAVRERLDEKVAAAENALNEVQERIEALEAEPANSD